MKNLINSIENNNFMTEGQKATFLETMCDDRTMAKKRVQNELKLIILQTLHDNGNAMTITEIQSVIPTYDSYYEGFSVQRISALTRQLVCMGMVSRNEIATGNSIIVKGKKYPEIIAKFSFINA